MATDTDRLYERTVERNRGLLERILRRLETIRESGEGRPGAFEDEFGGDLGPEPPTEPGRGRK